MFRLFLALNILVAGLYACKDGYDACSRKITDSKAIVQGSLHIPVDNGRLLVFSATPPNKKIIKHDPYLSLYLIEDDKKFKYPFRINKNLSLGEAGVDSDRAIEGRIAKKQVGLNSFASFSEPLFAPSLLLNSCCALEGIVTPRGIIGKEYLDRFLNTDKVSYADIGIRVDDKGKEVVVVSSNPFFKDNGFQTGDVIAEFDSKKVKDASSLMRDILFGKIGVLHKVKIKRGEKYLVVDARSQKRLGGGYLSDTFLEFFGISFDRELSVVKIMPQAQKYAVKTGDRLLSVNGVGIKDEQDILKILSNAKNSVNLLFERGGFQFFVKVN